MISSSKINVRKKVRFLLFVYFLFTFANAYAHNGSQLTKQQWLEDLNYVKKTLIDKHPDIYYRISKDDFEMTVAKTEQRIRNSHSDEECLIAIRQVIASIRDGHTMLGTNNLPGYRDIFPVRMYEFSNSIYITGIAEQYARYIGAKVINIGRLSAKEAFDKAGTLAFADNDFYKKELTPLVVITCKLVYGLGITEKVDQLTLLVESEDGEREEFVLFPVTPPGANNMLRGMDIGPIGIPFASAFTGTQKEHPLYLKHLDGDQNYWFEHDKEHRAIYMQFNLVVDDQNESFNDFTTNMFGYIDNHSENIDKFILDLRFNNGGNGPIVLPFINEIIKRDKINQLGCLYTLIGRRSFSAAVLIVAEMMIHTQTLIVGEPAGAAQNMFSDLVNRGTLPNSGATLFISSEYFNIAWPGNKKYIIPPHYPAVFSSMDFFSGKDPALEAIFANRVKALETVLYEEGPKAALDYFNEINFNWGLHSDELSIMLSTFPITKYKFGDGNINTIGYDLMKQNKMEEAGVVFALNVKLFPNSFNVWDSYAEYYYKIGDNLTAIKYYKKSLELNPSNKNAMRMIEKIEKQ